MYVTLKTLLRPKTVYVVLLLQTVLVDVTAPVQGSVKDSPADKPTIQFSSEAAVASASWTGFFDPESGIEGYVVTFLRTFRGNYYIQFIDI